MRWHHVAVCVAFDHLTLFVGNRELSGDAGFAQAYAEFGVVGFVANGAAICWVEVRGGSVTAVGVWIYA